MSDGVNKINKFAVAMLEQASLEDLLWSIAQGVGDIMRFDDCVIYLAQQDMLIQMAAFGIKNKKDREIFKRIKIPMGVGIVGSVAASKKIENVANTRLDKRYINDQYNGLSELAVPVVYEDKTIAVIDTESDKIGNYTKEDEALLQVIANIAAPRIASALYQQKLKNTQIRLQRANKELSLSLKQIEIRQAALIESEKMASIGLLSAGIAHEINTPLGYSISNLHVLQEYLEQLFGSFNTLTKNPALHQKVNESLDIDECTFMQDDSTILLNETIKGLMSAKNIMQDLKYFSNQSTEIYTLVNINDGINATLNILRSELKQNYELVLDLQPLPNVYVNLGKINQVFMNLIVNAKQAMKSGGTIFISSAVIESHIVVEIKDTGPGIAKTDLKNIFTPFFTTKPVGEGTGLGLAICYSIICNEHKGRIEVDSNENGTCFTLYIPHNMEILKKPA